MGTILLISTNLAADRRFAGLGPIARAGAIGRVEDSD